MLKGDQENVFEGGIEDEIRKKKKVSILTNEYQELVQDPLTRKMNNTENRNTGKETVSVQRK